MIALKLAVASLLFAGTAHWWFPTMCSAVMQTAPWDVDPQTDDGDVVLIDFSSPDSSVPMETVDDPVMGGKSHSSTLVGPDRVIWTGEVEIVDFLDAPGFCNLQTVGHQNFSALADTTGISFLVDASKSDWLHPMGLQIETGYRKFGIPVVYWCPAVQRPIDEDGDTVELYAPWNNFTAAVYGQEVKAPALDATELAKTNLVGMTTYLSHQAGTFHLELLSVIGRK